MARRTNSPAKTLLLLALVGAAGWFAYREIHVHRALEPAPAARVVPSEERERLRQALLERYADDRCFLDVGAVVFREKEGVWRIDITVAGECQSQARGVCREVAAFAREIVEGDVSVFAYSEGGSPVGRHVD